MKNDRDVIKEIRESRLRMSQQCNHNPLKYIDYLKTFNSRYSIQVGRYRKQHRPVPAKSVQAM